MIFDSKHSEFIKFDNLSKFKDIKHFVSTRKGGISGFKDNDLNISFETYDSSRNVITNRLILARKLGIDIESFVMQNQVHGNKVVTISYDDRGKGIYCHEKVIGDNDAMITNKQGICLFTFAADCVPILFYDSVNQAIGVAHAGWKGTVKKIARETVLSMQKKFKSKQKDIFVGIGPSISVKNYEVGENVVEEVKNAFGTTDNYMIFNKQTNKFHFDLWYTNTKILTDSGIPKENIELSNLCTLDNSDLFFSARKEENTGRFGAGIYLL
jgi:YfiH family protein